MNHFIWQLGQRIRVNFYANKDRSTDDSIKSRHKKQFYLFQQQLAFLFAIDSLAEVERSLRGESFVLTLNLSSLISRANTNQ